MPDILTKTEQVTAPPPGMALYLVLDPNGTPADRWALLSVLAQSTAWSDIYAVQADLPQADTSEDIIPDAVSSPGFLKWDASSLLGSVNDLSVILGGHRRITGARLATIAPLPACTYSNGAAGVGATLTGDVVGALADIDFTTPVAGDRILVTQQANGYENGLYEVTTLGSGGAAFVLTRVLEAALAATYLQGVTVEVGQGDFLAGSRFTAQGTYTIGTTTITWRGLRQTSTPGEAFFGASRNRRAYGSDFEEFETTVPAVAGAGAIDERVPGTPFGLYASATAGTQVSQVGGTDTVPGSLGMSTGTTAAGHAAVRAGQQAFTGNVLLPFSFYARVKIATALSDGSQTFVCRVGAMSQTNVISGIAVTAGVYLEAPTSGGNWRAVVANASTGLTGDDTGVAAGTSYIPLACKYLPEWGEVRFYIFTAGAWEQVAAIATTNFPTVSLIPGALISKSVGTTARAFHVDRFDVSHPEPRANFMLVP